MLILMQKILIFGIEMSVKTENNKKLIFGNKKNREVFLEIEITKDYTS